MKKIFAWLFGAILTLWLNFSYWLASDSSSFFFYNYSNLSLNGSIAWANFQSPAVTVNIWKPYENYIVAIITTSNSCSQFWIKINDNYTYNFALDNSLWACKTEFFIEDLSIFTYTLFYKSSSSVAPYARLLLVDKPTFQQSFKYLVSSWVATLWSSSCSKLSSLQCQEEYNLIPVENVDQNYCEINNLCPNSWSWENIDCPSSWFSRLSINWIDQDQSLLYQVNIPDYLNYDYVRYSDQISDLNIEWYNEDQDYIQWIIDTQNYKPTSEDFTNVFMNIIPYMKIIIFVLFLFLVWKMIRKVFK